MDPANAAWHVLNALALPLGVSALSVLAVKLLWRGQTQGTRALSLWLWAYLAALLAYVGTWAYNGVEGSMWGNALTVTATALAIWLRAFLWPRD
jgi:hypothetical protein